MIQERLFALQDEKYREFQRSLIPGLSKEKIIGIRMPAMRKLAKEFSQEEEGLRCLHGSAGGISALYR